MEYCTLRSRGFTLLLSVASETTSLFWLSRHAYMGFVPALMRKAGAGMDGVLCGMANHDIMHPFRLIQYAFHMGGSSFWRFGGLLLSPKMVCFVSVSPREDAFSVLAHHCMAAIQDVLLSLISACFYSSLRRLRIWRILLLY